MVVSYSGRRAAQGQAGTRPAGPVEAGVDASAGGHTGPRHRGPGQAVAGGRRAGGEQQCLPWGVRNERPTRHGRRPAERSTTRRPRPPRGAGTRGAAGPGGGQAEQGGRDGGPWTTGTGARSGPAASFSLTRPCRRTRRRRGAGEHDGVDRHRLLPTRLDPGADRSARQTRLTATWFSLMVLHPNDRRALFRGCSP